MVTSMATETDTSKGVMLEKITPSISLKPKTIKREIAATTSTWEIGTNTSKDIELDIKVATTTPFIIVRAGLLRYMAVKRLAKVDGTAT
jgi:hypothetical protein